MVPGVYPIEISAMKLSVVAIGCLRAIFCQTADWLSAHRVRIPVA